MSDGTTLLILGASGDLTSRLLLPGLAKLLHVQPERQLRVVGSDVAELSDQEWQDRVSTAMLTADDPGESALTLIEDTRYVAGDATDSDHLKRLIDSIDCARLVIYFALPPDITSLVCQELTEIRVPDGSILALEKPFGSDLASAHALNELITRIVPEQRVFRIDHFLGLHTVLNVLGLRFANRIFEPVWNSENIDRIEIYYDETVTLEGRAGYYDRSGALIDMIQSHLLQVMAVIAIDPPATIGERDLRDAVGQVLRAARVPSPTKNSRRARYTAGEIGDRSVPDYAKEADVDPKRETETLAEISVQIDNRRWAGVPFVLRSGKAFGEVRKQVIIHFKAPPHIPGGFRGASESNRLILDFRPDTFELRVTTNGRGDPFTFEQSALTGELGMAWLDPYGQVLASILDSDPRLAVRGDAAEECWRIIDPVIATWNKGKVPLDEYPAGSAGPANWRTTVAE